MSILLKFKLALVFPVLCVCCAMEQFLPHGHIVAKGHLHVKQ